MIKHSFSKKIAIVSTALVISMVAEPMQVLASENSFVLQTAGVSSILENTLTVEEYIEAAEQARGAMWGYTNLGIANVGEGNLNVRQEPTTASKLVGKMPHNAACEVLDIDGEWAHILSGEVDGYVNTEYLITGPDAKLLADDLVRTVAVAEVNYLNVRSEPNTNSKIYTKILKGTELDYIETIEDWVKIDLDGEEAYVSAEYVTVKDNLRTALTMTELLYGEGVSDVRVDIVEYAKQFLGNPYVWGGTSLTKGADCSGFVLSIFKKYGVTLSHHSGTQANEGTKIKESELKPADLIFYTDSNGKINHVAMYIGNGEVIHASSPKTGIKISKYNYRTPVKYVRVIYD